MISTVVLSTRIQPNWEALVYGFFWFFIVIGSISLISQLYFSFTNIYMLQFHYATTTFTSWVWITEILENTLQVFLVSIVRENY